MTDAVKLIAQYGLSAVAIVALSIYILFKDKIHRADQKENKEDMKALMRSQIEVQEKTNEILQHHNELVREIRTILETTRQRQNNSR